MAIYHLSAKIISRAMGRTSTGAIAYRAGIMITDVRSGAVFDYRRKRGIGGTEILAPNDSPAWVNDRAKLWNAVEQSEKRKDAQLAREIEIAIPKELAPEQGKDLVRRFVSAEFVARGMVADIAFHHLTSNNPHAHIMLTLRNLTSEGFVGKAREWNEKALLELWREQWAIFANDALKDATSISRIDHRTLLAQAEASQAQGDLDEAKRLDRLPMLHEGKTPARARLASLNETRKAENARRVLAWTETQERARNEGRLVPAVADGEKAAGSKLAELSDQSEHARQAYEMARREAEIATMELTRVKSRLAKSQATFDRRALRIERIETAVQSWRQAHPLRSALRAWLPVLARPLAELDARTTDTAEKLQQARQGVEHYQEAKRVTDLAVYSTQKALACADDRLQRAQRALRFAEWRQTPRTSPMPRLWRPFRQGEAQPARRSHLDRSRVRRPRI